MPEKLFAAIKKDHKEVKGIFEKMLNANKPELREKLLDELRSEIIPHLRAEEKTLYPVLRDEYKDCRQDALEGFEEHHAARLILNELQELPVEDEKFQAKVSVLKEMVEHHMKEEESTIFQDIKLLVGMGSSQGNPRTKEIPPPCGVHPCCDFSRDFHTSGEAR